MTQRSLPTCPNCGHTGRFGRRTGFTYIPQAFAGKCSKCGTKVKMKRRRKRPTMPERWETATSLKPKTIWLIQLQATRVVDGIFKARKKRYTAMHIIRNFINQQGGQWYKSADAVEHWLNELGDHAYLRKIIYK